MKREVDVSVILVNYRSVHLLTDAVDSILEKTEGISFEIIVVDNHSEDDALRILQERYGSRIVFLPLSENIGFGRANNEGIRIACGRNILFLNPDTLLINNAIKILNDYLNDHPDVGAVGGNLYTPDNSPNASFGRIAPSILDEYDRAGHRLFSRIVYGRNILFNHTGQPLSVAYICGADLMVRRRVLDEVGMFDPDFFMYYEETELCWRIRKAGYRIISIPGARIVHLEGQSFRCSYDRELRMFTSRLIYYRKTRSSWYAWWADVNYTLLTGIAWVFGFPAGREFRGKLRQRLKVLRQARKM